jgi:hypothetical protein
MTVNGLSCGLNMPVALPQQIINGQEIAQELPPYGHVPALVVDEYPACPQNWMRSSGDASSYFVPVIKDRGLWLDFNFNTSHTHHVAVVVSVQGVNAVTGQKTDKLRLEQYKKKCPVHKKEFGHERYCEECGFKWPTQNYIASNVTPSSYFWLDGFRTQDGEVRQYILTEEIVRGVASQLIGDERVFSIGVAFYISKEPKPVVESMLRSRGVSAPSSIKKNFIGTLYTSKSNTYEIMDSDPIGMNGGPNFYTGFTTPSSFQIPASADGIMESINSTGAKFVSENKVSADYQDEVISSAGISVDSLMACNNLDYDAEVDRFNSEISEESVEPIETTKLEIGAGAKIAQKIHPDTEKLSFWQKEPAGIIYINYIPKEDAVKIIAAGKKDMTGQGEGFLKDITVGVQ